MLRAHLKKGQIESLELELKKCESDLDRGILRDLYVRIGKADVLSTESFDRLDLKHLYISKDRSRTYNTSYFLTKQMSSAGKTQTCQSYCSLNMIRLN